MIDQQFTRILPASKYDLQLLENCAKADDHTAIAPQWVVERGSQIIGTIGLAPAVFIWMDTQRAKIRDSMAVMNFYENQLAAGGSSLVALPCVEKSPFRPFIERAGYVNGGPTTMFLKRL